MSAILAGLTAAFLLAPGASAQLPYTVWSTVLLTRNGETTPSMLGKLPTELTAMGANQAYNVGAFFRERYVTSHGDPTGIKYAPLVGINENPNYINLQQLSIAALDEQQTIATAQAFMQGFYPPYAPSKANMTATSMTNPSDTLANGTYIDGPMSGYQYAQISTYSIDNPWYTYLDGAAGCPAWTEASGNALTAAQFSSSDGLYDAVGSATLLSVLDPPYWSYANAYAIYDYLRYQNTYNATIQPILNGLRNVATNTSYLSELRWLADQQQYSQLGNLSAWNPITNAKSLNGGASAPGGVSGSISTIAGNTFAASVLAQLQGAVQSGSKGTTFSALNLLFAEFQPFVSFAALAQLPRMNSFFYGLPEFGSTMAFELFSYTNTSIGSGAQFPSPDQLYVRFLFRNGSSEDPTVSNGQLRSYPLFGNGPDQTDMTWAEFEAAMSKLALVQPANMGFFQDWCLTCGAGQTFCAAFNISDAGAAVRNEVQFVGFSGIMGSVVSGILGALIALVLAGLIFGALMLFAGVRIHRVAGRRSSGAGGFKGGQKMASDQDLTIPKGGAVVTQETPVVASPNPVPGGHERVGSWELKQPQSPAQQQPEQQAFDHNKMHDFPQRDVSFDEDRIDPFGDPVKPRESV